VTQLVSNILSTYLYDIKVIQTLHSTSHKLNVGPYGFIFLLQNILNLLSYVHIKEILFFYWTLGELLFFVYFTLLIPCNPKFSFIGGVGKIKIKTKTWM